MTFVQKTSTSLFLVVSAILLIPVIGYGQGDDQSEPAVAVVNGVRLPYRFFENERVNQMARLGVTPEDSSAFDQLAEDGVFLTVVDAELTLQEGRRRGVVVTRDDAIELLISNPPQYIRDIFAGQTYRPSTLRDLILKPETISRYIVDQSRGKAERIEQWKELTRALVRFYQVDETRRRLTDSLYSADPLTPEMVRNRYIAENAILSGSVVRVLHSTVPEEQTPITEEEAREWFRDHIDEYAVPESRRPLAIILKVVPTPTDSARQHEAIERARKKIVSLPPDGRGTVVSRLLEDLPSNRIPPNEYIAASRFGGVITNDLAAAERGDLLGPYPSDGETLMLYVADTRPANDTLVRARHILLNSDVVVDPDDRDKFSEAEIDEAIRALGGDLLDSIRTEEDFVRFATDFSQDYSSAGAGGDLGYASRGRYVPSFDSAVFNGPVGKVQGLIRTQFGYHLILVTDRSAKEYSLRELRFPIEPSDSVRRRARADAESFAARLRNGEPVAQVIGEIRGAYPGVVVDSGTFLKRLEAYADGLAIGEFLFRHNEGDVGVIPLPFDRISIVQVAAVWLGGVPRFEDIEAYPVAHARRKKQLDILEKRHVDMASKIDPETLLGPLREIAPDAEVFLLQKQPVATMDDEDPWLLDSLVAVTDDGEVSGPVRGTHAIYLLRVRQKIAPTERQIARDLPLFSEKLLRIYRSDLFEELLSEARANASIVDMRESTRQLIGASAIEEN